MTNQIFPINRPCTLNSFTFSNRETFSFFENLYLEYANKYNLNIQGTNNDSINTGLLVESYLRVTDLQALLLIHFCMIIESIINLYGVTKLGDDYYSKNIEKVTPVSRKIIILKTICSQEIYTDKEPIIISIYNYFDSRNGFIHPKHKEKELVNKFDDGILYLNKLFNLDEGVKYKELIKNFALFLVGNEKDNAYFFLSKYQW
jgi:hypothetical protein